MRKSQSRFTRNRLVYENFMMVDRCGTRRRLLLLQAAMTKSVSGTANRIKKPLKRNPKVVICVPP
jgi:hypothetical protein